MIHTISYSVARTIFSKEPPLRTKEQFEDDLNAVLEAIKQVGS